MSTNWLNRTVLRVVTTAIGIVVFSLSPALAWNSTGHKVVAEIAWQQLDSQQRQSIVEIIRRLPRFDTDFVGKMEDDAAKGDKATQVHWIFLNAAAWPDEIRKKKDLDRPTWHYIDLPLFLDESDKQALAKRLPVNISTDYPPKVPLDKMNILQALQHCQKTLTGKAGPEVKAAAYCWLLHLVGDIHQPLHCTALFSVKQFPKGDEGGNKILLVKGKNLHALWDGLLGTDSRMRNVEKIARELSNRDRFGDVWDTAAGEKDPKQWASESHDVAEAVVYSDKILDAVRNSPPADKIEPISLPIEYYKEAGEQARKRVLTAGLRLAVMLNSLHGELP
jgi:hypothetical protein